MEWGKGEQNTDLATSCLQPIENKKGDQKEVNSGLMEK